MNCNSYQFQHLLNGKVTCILIIDRNYIVYYKETYQHHTTKTLGYGLGVQMISAAIYVSLEELAMPKIAAPFA